LANPAAPRVSAPSTALDGHGIAKSVLKFPLYVAYALTILMPSQKQYTSYVD
jgi:hypothetical protein